MKTIFLTLPLVLGAFATWQVVTQSQNSWLRLFASIAAFLAGLMPSIYSALKFDDELEKCKLAAAEFKNLQDRFRQVAVFSSKKSFKEFEADFQAAMTRMEKVRQEGLTAPEWCFNAAQKKVQSNDYKFDVDIANEAETGGGQP